MEATGATVDSQELETKVKDMYRHVAEQPEGKYHFELGRALAEHLGYPSEVLDRIPDGAIESFAGVGYFFDLADLTGGESVIDLGSGSGMDVFFAAERIGPSGTVVGIDFTTEQLTKAREIADEAGYSQAEFREGRIEQLPADEASFDCVISNGVINLAPDKDGGLRRSDAGSEARRTARDRRHRQRAADEGEHRLRRRPLGLVHRWRRARGRLPRGDRGRWLADRDDQGQPLRVHLRSRSRRERQVRGQERLPARPEAGVARPVPGSTRARPCHDSAPLRARPRARRRPRAG